MQTIYKANQLTTPSTKFRKTIWHAHGFQNKDARPYQREKINHTSIETINQPHGMLNDDIEIYSEIPLL